jgi:hypothetical protein
MSSSSRRRKYAGFAVMAVLALATAAGAFAVGTVIFGREGEPAVQGVHNSNTHSPPTADEAHPVAGNFQPDETKIADCEGEFRCLEQAFGNLAYYTGPKATLRVFDRMMLSDKAVDGNCHRIVHSIGSASLARYDGNVAKAFAEGSASCWSGYYHGILERAFLDADRDELGSISRRLCDDEDIRTTKYLAYQCVHGLGHGLMIYTGYNLPVSLDVCDALATPWDQNSCSGGVFMENISSTYGVKSRWLKDDDLVYPCNAVAKRHKYYCYMMLTSRVLEANGYDWKPTADLCTTVERDWIEICFQSLGRDASGATRQEAGKILKLCRLGGEWMGECVYGAARDITANDSGTRRSIQLCSRAPIEIRARCFDGIGTILADLSVSDSQTRKACAAVTKRYFRACIRGAGLPLDAPAA